MSKKILVLIILILLAVVAGETIFLFKAKSGGEAEQKTQVVADQNFNKGIKDVYVQVRVKADIAGGQFTDSLYYTSEEWLKITAEDVQKSIQNRISKWTSVTTTPENTTTENITTEKTTPENTTTEKVAPEKTELENTILENKAPGVKE